MQKWTTKMESTRKIGLGALKLQKSQQSKSMVNDSANEVNYDDISKMM